MAVKKYNPTTPGRRDSTSQDFSMLTASKPNKSLTVGIKNTSGRDSHGRISIRHRGSGVKKLYRIVPFKRLEDGDAKIISIEYDPNRRARIAQIQLPSGKHQYIIAADGIKVGESIECGDQCSIEIGNRMQLKNIPIGTGIHDVEMYPNSKGQICRSAGSVATLLAIEGNYAMIKLPSGEIRQFLNLCRATIGQIGNTHHNRIKYGKAGRMRLLGIRPTVRGKAMYPKAHPHGGGEGGNGIGMKSPKTKWGAKALGVKTRKKLSRSDIFIVKRRDKK